MEARPRVEAAALASACCRWYVGGPVALWHAEWMFGVQELADLTDLLGELNEQQLQAVTAPLGPCLVLAGPGSGKTRVLTHRIAYLIRHYGIEPWHILAVTFTNKAANEMRSRLQRMLGEEAGEVTLGTFHAVCARWLRRDADRFGVSRKFVIYDTDDQTALMKTVLEELNVDDRRYRPGAVLADISRAKSEMIGADEYRPRDYWHEIVARAYQRYQQLLQRNDGLDFDDLLLVTVKGLQRDEELRRRYQARYKHLLVDEFQDTNMPQYELIQLLASTDGSLFVVGDEDQSIYGWRGADYRNVDRLRRAFPELHTLLLETNYRSTQMIVDAAKGIISHNLIRTPKNLRAAGGTGEPVVVREAYSRDDEAEFVVSEIERLVAAGEFRLGDFAVMYRMNAQSRAVEEAFLRHRLPYRLVGGVRFYQRREIKDVLSYLRLLVADGDWVSFERVVNAPSRGIGEVSLRTLRQAAGSLGLGPYEALCRLRDDHTWQHGLTKRAVVALVGFLEVWDRVRALAQSATVADLIDAVLISFEYSQHLGPDSAEAEERLQNIRELRAVAVDRYPVPGIESLASFLDGVALVAEVDQLEEGVEAPVLMTLHTAKGLEFPVVFIVGMQEGILPHSRAVERLNDNPSEGLRELEEERRLCYVGITRAMRRLYLLHSLSGGVYGQDSRNQPSRFLKDLPPEVLATADRRQRARASRQASALSTPVGRPGTAPEPAGDAVKDVRVPEYRVGETVVHARFGEGVVIEYKPTRNDADVTVAFANKGVKRLLASIAPLERK